jgi:ketosteroid isomerase-like protein
MKRTLVWCLLGLISLGSVALSQAQQTGGPEKVVAAQEQQWLKAQKSNNPDLLSPLLSDKFVSTSSEGKVTDKTQALADVKSMKWSSAGYTDVKVTVFGNTAIATGVFDGKGTDEAGKPLDVHERWTDTWLKVPGAQWQCIASHASPIKG